MSVSMAAQQISLLTCGAGDETYSMYGHCALRVYDVDRDFDIVYNYGMFDFQTPGFLIKFLRGKLPYWVGAQRYSDFLYQYKREKRSVTEQKLNLTVKDTEKILKALRINMQPENREYAYDFFFDNCSTRLRDIAEKYVGDSIVYSTENRNVSYRNLLKENQSNWPWYDFGVDLLIGATTDKQAKRTDQMFLPQYLSENLGSALVYEKDTMYALMEAPYPVLEFNDQQIIRHAIPWYIPSNIMPLLAILLLLIRMPYRTKKDVPKWLVRADISILTLFGILGIILLFMWFGTNHLTTKQNWNLLWLSPLLIVVLVGYRNSATWLKSLIYVMLGLCLICLINVWCQFLPQYFPPTFGWLILIEMMLLIWMERRVRL